MPGARFEGISTVQELPLNRLAYCILSRSLSLTYVGNEVVRGPVTGVAAGVQASLGDLGPLEGGLVDGSEVARDSSDVVNDGAVVRLGPGVPLESDRATSSNAGSVGGGSSTLVADDVGGASGVGLNEAVVLVAGRPANSVGGGTVGESTSVLSAVSNDGGDVAVSVDGRGHGNNGEDLGKHFEDCL